MIKCDLKKKIKKMKKTKIKFKKWKTKFGEKN